ncbi:MAG TPA: P-II family nitrogen regulator [Terriglobia bacterium]|nr:P-II family nitrogen regulator [Terriglobia bacterium]
MKRIEAVIQSSRLEHVKPAPHEIGAEGITVWEAHGHGRQKEITAAGSTTSTCCPS